VFPKGFEPLSSEPESEILSIELRERIENGSAKVALFPQKPKSEAKKIISGKTSLNTCRSCLLYNEICFLNKLDYL
jgi:hypothetical protein